MKVRIDKHKQLNMLVVEPENKDKDTSVLLFLHGRGEASGSINGLPLVLMHHSPPFQAIMGRLRDVTVVAPQAPHPPDSGWDWSAHLGDISDYLSANFSQRKILATGFSRGGLGVLQLLRASPQTVSKWAVVDPQPGDGVLPTGSSAPNGWLAYGTEYDSIQAFSQQLSKCLKGENSHFTNYNHPEVALKAYEGAKLGGGKTIYEFLGLEYVADAA
jgi:pimeloyl-ACP methyl ester carboxylesterase